jgi:hypothetical protein
VTEISTRTGSNNCNRTIEFRTNNFEMVIFRTGTGTAENSMKKITPLKSHRIEGGGKCLFFCNMRAREKMNTILHWYDKIFMVQRTRDKFCQNYAILWISPPPPPLSQ